MPGLAPVAVALALITEYVASKEIIAEEILRLANVGMMVDLSRATVVTIYLSREANPGLRSALRIQLRPGAVLLSHDFDMGDWRPEAVRQLLDESGRTRRIYLWRIAGRQPRP